MTGGPDTAGTGGGLNVSTGGMTSTLGGPPPLAV
jgi:hypothetical protein